VRITQPQGVLVKRAKWGDKVKVHYVGRFDDGQVFGSTMEGEPLEFTLGGGKFIRCFEDAIADMDVGQKKLLRVPAEEACGPRKDELVLRVDRKNLPPNIDPKEGLILNFKRPSGDVLIEATIAEVSRDSVALDINHPLAGKNLTFYIELIEIV
jgi:peptidylprolyl isomerase